MRVLTRFMLSATDERQFPPPAVPEVAFLGRSNVGKSSVINSLVGKKLAHTSSTPGRTRSINFFEVRLAGRPKPDVVFADLPGYGYARISREVSSEWPTFIEPYLEHRTSLALCVTLLDLNVPPQNSDRQLLQFLNSIGRTVLVVGTKCDRLSGNQLTNAMRAFTQEYPDARILPFSAKTSVGRDELWREIRTMIEMHERAQIANRTVLEN
jgi:GTP-binding protein